MKPLVITIGREFGSSGKEIGLALAERLGIPCYDKELLERAAEDSEFCKEIFEHNDEKPSNSFLYSFALDSHSFGGCATAPSMLDIPLNQKVFLAQFDTIKKIAEQESCVIIGRCADYALQDDENMVSVFIKASTPFKVHQIMKRSTELIDQKTALELMQKTDKKRANYYNYYTSKRWGDSRSYDLCLNASDLGVEGCVDMIIRYIELKKKYQES